MSFIADDRWTCVHCNRTLIVPTGRIAAREKWLTVARATHPMECPAQRRRRAA